MSIKSKAELEILESEAKVARRRAEDERIRLSTDERDRQYSGRNAPINGRTS